MSKRLIWVTLIILCLTVVTMAQTKTAPAAKAAPAAKVAAVQAPEAPDAPPTPPRPPFPRIPRAWWKDSQTAAQLNLNDQQKTQLEQTFTDYRMKLIDLRAGVEREEAKLEPLVDSDKLDANAVSSQLDAIIAARGKLEKTVAMMGIDMRRILTPDQWKKLRELHPGPPGMFGDHHGWDRGPRDREHFRRPGARMRGPGMGPGVPPPPAPSEPPQDEE